MDKIISSPDAATGKTTATVKDFSLDFRKFQMWMEHRTLEEFYDYIDNVETITHRFQKKHHEVFEIKEDNYVEEWTEFIKETYGDMVVEEATDFYKNNDGEYYPDPYRLQKVCMEYAIRNNFIINDEYLRICVIDEFDDNRSTHDLAKYIKGYAYAYEAAVNFGIAKSKFRHAIEIPFSKFYKKDVEILKKYQDKIFELVYMLDVESMIERVSVYDEENCVIVCYK